MKRLPVTMVATIAASIAAAALGEGVTWDFTAQFSGTQGNPNGAWSYGWYDASFSTFTLFNPGVWCDACPGWYIGPTGDWTPNVVLNSCGCFNQYVVPLGWVTLHPGPSQQAATVRFTVPSGAGGPLRVAGEFLPGDGGWMQVAVRHNGAEVFHAPDSGVFDLLLTAAPGDAVEFTVYGGYAFGNTPLRAVVTSGACAADIGTSGGLPGHDGRLDNNDFIAFITFFFDQDRRADCGVAGGLPGADGEFNNNDFIAFINSFFAGC